MVSRTTLPIWSQVPALPQNFLKAHKVVVRFAVQPILATWERTTLIWLSSWIMVGGCSCPVGTSSTRMAAPPTSCTTICTSTGTAVRPKTIRARAAPQPGSTIRSRKGWVCCRMLSFDSLGFGGADFSDQLTPVAPAISAFTDTGTNKTNGLLVQDTTLGSSYKVMSWPSRLRPSTALPVEAI